VGVQGFLLSRALVSGGLLDEAVDQSPGLDCMIPPSAKMVVAVM
jgi:hypothetical protein